MLCLIYKLNHKKKQKSYEEYNKDRVFFTSTINNNGIEELKKYILKELSKFEA